MAKDRPAARKLLPRPYDFSATDRTGKEGFRGMEGEKRLLGNCFHCLNGIPPPTWKG